MHDIKWIRDNPDAFDQALKRRGLPGEARALIALDEARRAAITASEQAQAARNAASKEIGEAKKAKDEARANDLMAKVAELKDDPAGSWKRRRRTRKRNSTAALAQIPNLPLGRRARRQPTKTAMSSITSSERSAITPSRRSSISNSAKRSARWISRPPPNSPARASSC